MPITKDTRELCQGRGHKEEKANATGKPGLVPGPEKNATTEGHLGDKWPILGEGYMLDR